MTEVLKSLDVIFLFGYALMLTFNMYSFVTLFFYDYIFFYLAVGVIFAVSCTMYVLFFQKDTYSGQ
jgi:hypothetical protein